MTNNPQREIKFRVWDGDYMVYQSQGRHVPLHPSSPTPIKIAKDKYIFPESKTKPRRLSVR